MSIFGALGTLVGGLFSGSQAKKAAERQAQLQREFAQNSVQWRVADAKKAGVGTLAALGMQPISYSPVTVGGPDWSDIGQNIGRAADAAVDVPDRQMNKAASTLQLENMQLQNDAIRLQLLGSARALRTQAGTPPPVPDALDREISRQDIRGKATDYLRERDPLPMGPVRLQQSSRYAPAQKVEDEYADVVSNVYGVAKFIRDYNLSTRPQKGDWNYPLTKRYWMEKWNQNSARTQSRYLERRRGDHGYW